jgi:ABC-2 type transport system permease protein
MWSQDEDLMSAITSGVVAYEYCRPYNLYFFWLARLAATRVASVLLRCFPILLITSLLPAPWCMNAPGGIASLLLFLVSLSLSMVLAVTISMFIYITAFVTLNVQGSRLLISMGAELFSGAIIPIPLMPEWFQPVVRCLPFAYTADVPFRIYSGDIPPGEAWLGILIQLLWILLLVAAGYGCFRRIQRRVVIQGG